nr:hypothetical protein [Streptomyces lydicus]
MAEEYPGHAVARPAEVDAVELCGDEMRLALPPDSAYPADDPAAALRALNGRPWVMEPTGTASRRWATAVCRQAGSSPTCGSSRPICWYSCGWWSRGTRRRSCLTCCGAGARRPCRRCRCRAAAAPGGSSRPYGTAAKVTRRPGPAVRRCDAPSYVPAACPERLAGPAAAPRNR